MVTDDYLNPDEMEENTTIKELAKENDGIIQDQRDEYRQ